ncbi:hypothetical protein QBC46DRAFT_434149 [Diplogelasinospora grovesii]|uniref:Uncharacterized protein n=1 Tax=Diplogelasinospora grovesii TaxID=303347 RepID=A0AAN6RYJ0_9PEZI|nr:hypothetical protein QBC46DRAFT_434149 [Diplogelasinospora grovesii]
MSGSGGFYKYRCKYFYTHNCPNWVWVNNSPCASCLAEGRDADDNVSNSTAAPSWRLGKEIYVSQVYGEDGDDVAIRTACLEREPPESEHSKRLLVKELFTIDIFGL